MDSLSRIEIALCVLSLIHIQDTTKAQDIALWPIEIFQTHDISDVVVASYDEAGFADSLSAQIEEFNATQTASANAHFAFDEEAGTYTLVPEVYGTQIDAEKLLAKEIGRAHV